MEQAKIIVVGKLGSTYGIRGWLRVYSSTEIAESIFDYQPWQLKINGQWQHVEIESWKHHNNDLIVKLKSVADRDAAQRLTNVEIGVPMDILPSLSDGDYYWHDLIGCEVYNQSNYHMGRVSDMLETGSNDVLVVQAKDKDAFGKQERLIPYLDTVVKRVDLATKTIIVDWDAGF